MVSRSSFNQLILKIDNGTYPTSGKSLSCQCFDKLTRPVFSIPLVLTSGFDLVVDFEESTSFDDGLVVSSASLVKSKQGVRLEVELAGWLDELLAVAVGSGTGKDLGRHPRAVVNPLGVTAPEALIIDSPLAINQECIPFGGLTTTDIAFPRGGDL